MEIFSQNLKKFRKRKNISQIKLAKLLNVTQAAISYWERGERQPDIQMIRNICYVLNVSADELIETDKINIQTINNKQLINNGKFTNNGNINF